MSDAGIPARHLARSPERAPKLAKAEVKQCRYEYSPQALEALSGIEVLFMVSDKEAPNRLQEHLDFIDAAKEAGVKHIIYTSFYNASPKATFTLARDHAATEQYIKEKGLTYTFLRDNFYMDFFVALAQEYGEIKGPAGNGKVSAVVRSDVAKVAVAILKDSDKWANQTLDMTGPEALTLSEMAEQLSHLLGKTISYVEETVEEAYASRKAWPAED